MLRGHSSQRTLSAQFFATYSASPHIYPLSDDEDSLQCMLRHVQGFIQDSDKSGCTGRLVIRFVAGRTYIRNAVAYERRGERTGSPLFIPRAPGPPCQHALRLPSRPAGRRLTHSWHLLPSRSTPQAPRWRNRVPLACRRSRLGALAVGLRFEHGGGAHAGACGGGEGLMRSEQGGSA